MHVTQCNIVLDLLQGNDMITFFINMETIHRGLITRKPQGRNLKFSYNTFSKYFCIGVLIHHNIGNPLKHNKYIFDIPIPFCHNLYLCNFFYRICRFWNQLPCCLHVNAAQALWLVELTNQIARRNMVRSHM